MKLLVKLFCGMVLLACTKAKTSSTMYYNTSPSGPQRTWLALGDSYTIGKSVPETDRFPNQTANTLHLSGIIIGTPDYIATTGWTTTDLMNNIQTQNPATHDVVTLLIGVNDEYQRHDTTGYRQRFTDLLVKSIQLANGKRDNVFVLSIPDYSVTPFAASSDTVQIRKEIDWFNAINKSVTAAYRCPYLDITPFTREGRYNSNLIAGDGLHPSGLEYKKWADRLAVMMVAVLK